ncbi:MAG: hypothetical protein R3245_06405 [Kiloniellales bacterium]|nr:hypothetical protein [Kiloniellales bacterium]
MLPPLPVISRCKLGVLAPPAFLAATKLDVFSGLADGPRTAETSARDIGLDLEWMEPLLFARAATGLLVYKHHRIPCLGSRYNDRWQSPTDWHDQALSVLI